MVRLVKLVAIHTDTGGDPLTIKLTVNLVRLVPLMGTTTGGTMVGLLKIVRLVVTVDPGVIGPLIIKIK